MFLKIVLTDGNGMVHYIVGIRSYLKDLTFMVGD